MNIQALLFDKDGTLFDFEKTWNAWSLGIIRHYANGSAALADRIATAIGFDLENQCFQPTSPVIAGTNRQAAELLASALPDPDVAQIEQYLAESAVNAPLAPVVALDPLLRGFRQLGLKLGVVTNDTERGARAHLEVAKVLHMFDFIAGHDSGIGSKPDPDPLLAFAQQQDLSPTRVAMVGDSTHDLIAGRRAGMVTIGVLTGMATEADLAPYADVILPDIGYLPKWLETA
ncbi:MAG: HAD family hydrolase [Cognatishimia sp.]|uniref:HAD family hydrolase n=1 Tax=Cognatishimia sp. TaxID=2211648 RepID=UPI003B8C479F